MNDYEKELERFRRGELAGLPAYERPEDGPVASTMTVFVVSDGEYSNRHIVGIFSDRRTAECCATAIGVFSDRIEEYPLDPEAERYRQGLALWSVTLTMADGELFDERPHRCRQTEPSDPWLTWQHDHRQCPTRLGVHLWPECLFRGRYGPVDAYPEHLKALTRACLTVEVWARDEEGAIKAAHERWAGWKATCT